MTTFQSIRRGLQRVTAGALLALLLASSSVCKSADDLLTGPMFVGFTKSCFINTNRNDAEAGFKVFMETVGRNNGYRLTPLTKVYDDLAEFESAMKTGKTQLAVMDAWQFLTLDVPPNIKPFFVPVERTTVGRDYLVLTRRGSGLKSLSDLRGQGLNSLEKASAGVGRHWLDTILLSNGLGTQTSFFGKVQAMGKPTAAILPVFFGKASCCFVDQASFDIMAELNPQVGRELEVVLSSKTYLNVVICLGETGWVGTRGKEDTITGLRDLHLTPSGQQILSLFKMAKLVPFDDAQLDTTRELRAAHQQGLQAAKQ